MANNRIQIKRSTTTAITNTTPSINAGELVFSSNGYILAIGDPANSANVISIGGARFPGTLTANQALVANATSGIDKVIVANLAANSVWANGSSGSAGDVLYSNGSAVYWKAPSADVAGTDTQVQFNDGGSLAGDAGLTYNKTTDTLTSGNLVVSGTTGSTNTTTGALTVAGGVGVLGRINVTDVAVGNDSVYATINNSVIGTNNLFATGTVNGSVLSVGGWVIANTSGVFTSGVVNGDIIRVGTSVVANTTRFSLGTGIGFQVNGSIGSAGEILYSNGTSAYWAAAPTGDITAVTAGSGLTGGGTAGDVTLDVGSGNGISVSADAIAVLANNGIVSNTSGVFAAAANGISVTASGINVLAGNSQLISNASGVFVNAAALSIATSQLSGDVALGTQTSGNYVATVAAGNGMVVAGSGSETADVTVSVLANTGVVANSTGIFIGQPVSTTSNVTFANVVTTLFTSSGNTILGTTTADTLNTRGSFSNNLMPSANVTYDVGSNAMRWREIHASNVHSTVGYFDGNLEVGGDIIVTGNLVTQNVQSVVISDPMIYLAGNNYTSDLVDIGFAGNYYDGATQRHTGFFRDATDGIYKLFANSTQELSGNNTVDTSATGYVTASLVAYLQSGGLTTNATSVYITANSTVNVNISANVLSISDRANNDLLFANSTGGITGLALGTSGYVVQSNGTAIVYDTLDGGTF